MTGRAGAEPRVSIVLPTFNRAAMLPAAIESVLAQTFDDFELIVVDDGSTDATAAVAERYAARDRRVRVIRKPNGGLPAALNTGFAAARGALFTWTSDDNTYLPHALARMTAELDARPTAVLVYAGYTVVYDDGRPDETLRPGDNAFPAPPGVGACFLYRAAAARTVGEYDTEIPMAEDLDYWHRIAAVGPTAAVGESLYRYGLHAGTLTLRRRRAQRIAWALVRARRGGRDGLREAAHGLYWLMLNDRGAVTEPGPLRRRALKLWAYLALCAAASGLSYGAARRWLGWFAALEA